MQIMKKYLLLLIAVTLPGAVTHVSAAPDSATPRVVIAQTNHIKAVVEDINHEKRELTLKGPEGNLRKFVVSEDVKRFSNIRKGDELKVGYYEALAVALGKPGEPLPVTPRGAARISRGRGDKPAGSAAAAIETSATVEKIDRDKRTVTLKGPQGNEVTVEVDPEVGNLKQIKEGDEIAIRYMQALAISIETPKH